jgi:diaminohydroxyphosphoribosylaminopyrimidine deaminase / 5-amino-6-(5-phosphoribosylamino)uracil reductase
MNDNDYMQRALMLAARGAGRVSPNPMVGAVVVRGGRIVGEGFHQAVGGPHAEVHAIDAAGGQARGATLYVTLEPCNHTGRTPPCTEKILAAGIARVVSAMADPNPDVRGGGHARLTAHGIAVHCGVCEAEARRLNESFIKFVRVRRPFVVLKLAATLDGRIATRTGDARWVTGAAAREQVHRLRHALDAIMVGAGTVAADDPQLTARLPEGGGVDPVRIVLDSRLRMVENARMLHQSSPAATYVVCGPAAGIEDRRRLSAAGARIVEVPLKEGGIDLVILMERLGAMGLTSLLIEGGAQVAGSALAAGIVDKIVFHYAPKILGGDDGRPMLSGTGPDAMRDALRLCDVTIERLGDDIAVSGYVRAAQEQICLPES